MSYYIIIRGPLGAGKSTIAQKLAKDLHAKYINIDAILEIHGLTEEKEEGYISQKSFKQANTIANNEAVFALKNHIPVIFDGNFYWKSQIEHLRTLLPYKHFVFTLQAPLNTCIQRDEGRKKPHGKIAATVVYQKTTSFTHGIPIDVTNPIEESIKTIKKFLT